MTLFFFFSRKNQVKRHRVDGVRRLAAHSHLPLCKSRSLPVSNRYFRRVLTNATLAQFPAFFLLVADVTGCQDGSVRMWEWSHSQAVQNVRPSGVFAKVNHYSQKKPLTQFGYNF